MVVHYPRTVWKNSYAEHEVTVKHTYRHFKNNMSPENVVCYICLAPVTRNLHAVPDVRPHNTPRPKYVRDGGHVGSKHNYVSMNALFNKETTYTEDVVLTLYI